MLEFKNVSYSIGAHTILDDISACFVEDKINVMLGSNGAGKTTLLKLATGLTPPTSGQILFKGQDIGKCTAKYLAMHRSVVPQNFLHPFDFKVLDYIIYGRSMYFNIYPKKDDIEIAQELITKLHLDDLQHKNINSLSGGQRQMVEIARALCQIWHQERPYIFLDEHVSNLDIKNQFKIMRIIKDVVAQKNMSVVAILHDINLAECFADYIFLLKGGHMLYSGATQEVLTAEKLEETYEIPFNMCSKFQNRSFFFLNL